MLGIRFFFDQGTPQDLMLPYAKFDEVCKFLDGDSVKTVLDIACGSGRHAIALAKRGYYVYAFDMSRAALSIAEEQVLKNNVSDLVHLFVGDMFEKYNFPDGSLDAAIAIQAIYHGYPKDMCRAIDEVSRVLRSGGKFVFTLSRDQHRPMIGSSDTLSREVDYKTFLPLSGRECGLPHFYPDEEDVLKMTKGNFSKVDFEYDEAHNYLIVFCVK